MAQENSSNEKSSSVDLAKVAVLIVDDQKAARQLLHAYLLRIGVGKVEEATDKIEAMRVLTGSAKTKSPFRAVFVSRMMREMDALDLVSSIRQLAGWTDLPIVVVSEELDFGYVKDAVTVGASEYLIRPYDETALRSMLVRLLQVRS